MCFRNSCLVDARGFSGGLWFVWDDGDWNIHKIVESDQFIHLFMEKEGLSFHLTCVYASPNPVKRRELWGALNTSKKVFKGLGV